MREQEEEEELVGDGMETLKEQPERQKENQKLYLHIHLVKMESE